MDFNKQKNAQITLRILYIINPLYFANCFGLVAVLIIQSYSKFFKKTHP